MRVSNNINLSKIKTIYFFKCPELLHRGLGHGHDVSNGIGNSALLAMVSMDATSVASGPTCRVANGASASSERSEVRVVGTVEDKRDLRVQRAWVQRPPLSCDLRASRPESRFPRR